MRGEVVSVNDSNGREHGVNVAVCRRIGGERSILVCKRCYNEVEGSADLFTTGGGVEFYRITPRYGFCPWCSAPLKETYDG